MPLHIRVRQNASQSAPCQVSLFSSMFSFLLFVSDVPRAAARLESTVVTAVVCLQNGLPVFFFLSYGSVRWLSCLMTC